MGGRFPEYRPKDDKFSIWTESYGGHYAPIYSDFFEKQNELIVAGTIPAPAIQLRLDTIGLVNACIDIDTQMPTYPEFAFNNTYGIQAINATQYRSAVESAATCKNMTRTCQALADEQDPKGLGNNPTVNKACLGAYLYCFSNMHDGYDQKVRNMLPSRGKI
jgi:carboxypeptidase C (cathepsin A)